MSKCDTDDTYLQLSLYILYKRFHTPNDILKYWAVSGPCLESVPTIENLD
jgi:hypothetical protein